MFEVIVIFSVGIGVGFTFKHFPRLIKGAEKVSSGAIYLLLFLLGGLVGINGEVVRSFGRLGLTAAVLSAAAILGSGAVLFLIDRMVFRNGARP